LRFVRSALPFAAGSKSGEDGFFYVIVEDMNSDRQEPFERGGRQLRSPSRGAIRVPAAAVLFVSACLIGGAVGGAVAAVSQREKGRFVPFSIKTPANRTVSVGVRGKPGAVIFVPNTCGGCLRGAQALAELKRELGSRLEAAMVSLDRHENPQALLLAGSVLGTVPFPLGVAEGPVPRSDRGPGVGPLTVYGAGGRIVARLQNPTYDELRKAVLAAVPSAAAGAGNSRRAARRGSAGGNGLP